VVDVETSGLNALDDSLIAIGALAVSDGAIDLADSFEVVLRQHAPSTGANIEVHGIGGVEQLGGEEPRTALARFLAFAGDDPLVAYHAAFDATVLRRALRAQLRRSFHRHWLDLAEVAPLAWPGRAEGGLDAWLEALGIPVAYRHRAIVDCLATAQLFLAVLPEAPRLGAASARGLLALSSGDRWLGPMGSD
jgi:DNA polymerase III subunit epsilon